MRVTRGPARSPHTASAPACSSTLHPSSVVHLRPRLRIRTCLYQIPLQLPLLHSTSPNTHPHTPCPCCPAYVACVRARVTRVQDCAHALRLPPAPALERPPQPRQPRGELRLRLPRLPAGGPAQGRLAFNRIHAYIIRPTCGAAVSPPLPYPCHTHAIPMRRPVHALRSSPLGQQHPTCIHSYILPARNVLLLLANSIPG